MRLERRRCARHEKRSPRLILVLGGYGTFGTQVSRSLAEFGIPLTIAGRDEIRADALARSLGPGHRGIVADARDMDSCRRALQGVRVAVHCAGPFLGSDPTLARACIEAGCHYVDIAEDRAWCAAVRRLDSEFRSAGLVSGYGCSSLPGLSCALAYRAGENLAEVENVRVTLFLGNRNPKGRAAVDSAAAQIGRRFRTRERILTSFGEPVMVHLPAPFGRRRALNFESADYDEIPRILGAPRVEVKVSFELPAANAAINLLSRIGPPAGALMRALAAFQPLYSWWGHSGGAVLVEIFTRDGGVTRGSIAGESNGQRMAALPAAIVADRIYRDRTTARGALLAHEILGDAALLEGMARGGYSVSVEKGPSP